LKMNHVFLSLKAGLIKMKRFQMFVDSEDKSIHFAEISYNLLRLT